MSIPKHKLNKLKSDLRGRSLKPVADKLGLTVEAVYATLTGKSHNENTISALIEYRDELKKKTQELISRI